MAVTAAFYLFVSLFVLIYLWVFLVNMEVLFRFWFQTSHLVCFWDRKNSYQWHSCLLTLWQGAHTTVEFIGNRNSHHLSKKSIPGAFENASHFDLWCPQFLQFSFCGILWNALWPTSSETWTAGCSELNIYYMDVCSRKLWTCWLGISLLAVCSYM